MSFSQAALLALACLFAAGSGVCWGLWAVGRYRSRLHRRRVFERGLADALDSTAASSPGYQRDFFERSVWVSRLMRGKGVLSYLLRLQVRLATESVAPWMPKSLQKPLFSSKKAARLIAEGGLAGNLSVRTCREASLRLGLSLSLAGALLGSVISLPMAGVLMVAGAFAGVSAPHRALTRLKTQRSRTLERDLAEMLEVMALGLRGGLSFDRSMALYSEHFETAFAADCAAAQRAWNIGFSTREEALRAIVRGYDSPLLARTVESMIRSLRFGSSLAEVLEQAAAEARVQHRARVEERVAKAPVKMMVPTGALILPAMLLLVMGPVLLELMGGF